MSYRMSSKKVQKKSWKYLEYMQKTSTFAPAFKNETLLNRNETSAKAPVHWQIESEGDDRESSGAKDELQDDRVVRRGSSGLRNLLKKSFRKFFQKKSSPKIWRIYEKLLTFASAFPMKRKVPFGEIDLWKIYITRQSSTRAESEMIPGKNRQIPYYSNII